MDDFYKALFWRFMLLGGSAIIAVILGLWIAAALGLKL